MADNTTGTRVWRLEQRRNEELVRAESSLIGERRVAWVRLAMLVLFALGAHDFTSTPSPTRIGAALAYLAFGLAMLGGTRRATPSPVRAFYLPLVATMIDFGFIAFMALHSDRSRGPLRPEMGAVACAVLLAFSVARMSPWHVVASTLLAGATYAGLGVESGLITLPSTGFVLGGFLALGLLIALTNVSMSRTFAALRRRDGLTKLLPPAVVERLLERGERALEPTLREVTVLFSDIRDFTSLAEAASPAEVLRFLDDYFGRMSQVVKGHDGLVNKFIGDGMLAVWGVPDDEPAHARRALEAALDMRAALAELNRERAKEGQPAVRIGIGVHTGTVAAGMLGGAEQHEYTVIGDAVNLASRIEGLTKTLGHDILVSASTWHATGGRFTGARVGEERVKGRQESVVVYALEANELSAVVHG